MSLTPSAQASLNSQSDFNLNTKPVTQHQHHKEDTNHHNSKVTQSTRRKIQFHKALIFVLTFIAYALYSGTRQPFGITKSTLNPDHEKDPYAGPGYAPFNDKDWGSTYLGALDTVFLSFYAIGLFITGPLGDRLNLRWFLSIGMIGSGAFCFLFGSASLFSMHSLGWFIVCNIFAGLFQATGWPSTVTLMTRWFGKGNRGTIMGIWNAQSSIGNIIGKFWATFWLHQYGWGWAFMGTGLLCIFVGFIQMAFVIPHPHDILTAAELDELERMNNEGHIAQVSIMSKEDEEHVRKEEERRRKTIHPTDASSAAAASVLSSSSSSSDVSEYDSSDPLTLATVDRDSIPLTNASSPSSSSPTNLTLSAAKKLHHDDFESISFMKALSVPGVLEYSACLFFAKLVAYAFNFWLPYYLSNLNYSDNAAGNISTVYDMGGVAGGILAGWASDYTGKRGVVSVTMLLLCLPGLWVYSFLAGYGLGLNICLMFLVGILVNGPFTLISGVVAADLGNHPSLKGNPKAMSTVTGIVDGSGSVGAALQGVLIGVVGKRLGWTYVFYLLEGFCALAAVCLFRIMSKEVGPIQTWRICQRQQATRSTAPSERSNSFSHQGIHSHRGKGGDRDEDEDRDRDRDRDEYEYEVDELESGLSDSRSVSRLKDETKPLSPTSRTKADLHERLIRNISTDR